MKKSNNTISNWLKKYRNPEIEEQVEKEIEMGEKSPLIDLSNKKTYQDKLKQQKVMGEEVKSEYPLLGKDDVCRLMELSYDMGKKGERYSLWELYLFYIKQNKDE
jgi:hypothetical protein